MSIPADPSPLNREDVCIEALSIVPASDLSTRYTETSLIGAGRTIGILYSSAGRRLERVVGNVAHKAGYGPQATYLKIQELIRTEWKVEIRKVGLSRYSSPSIQLNPYLPFHFRALTMQTMFRVV